MGLIEHIKADFSLSANDVRILLLTAPYRYKLHYIEKRNGRGKRLIAQPTAEIKILQKWVIANYSDQLPVHQAAMAYRTGVSIRCHAQLHASNKYLLKVDFKDFFPSISGDDCYRHLKKFTSLIDEDLHLLVRLLCRSDSDKKDLLLSIGAPSSPMISNTIMFDFDNALTKYCIEREMIYSRYADDIAISTNQPKVLDNALAYIQELCRELAYPKLTINDDKTVFTSKKFNRQLTGLTLSNEGKVSLGRDKKRLIRAMAHHYSVGKLEKEKLPKLRGLIAYAHSIEPEYVLTLKEMIGEEAFNKLTNGN